MLKSRLFLAALAALPLAGAVAAGGPTLAQPQQSNQCIYVRNINGFNAPNDRTVYVRTGSNQIFRLDLMASCTGLTFRENIGLQSTPGDPWICNPLQAEIVYRDTGIHNRCPVTAIHKLSPDEVAALPPRDRP